MILKLKAMLVKELKQMLRDPKMRMVVFVMPIVQMLVMSFALTLDVKNIDIAVLDLDRTGTTSEAVIMLQESGYFNITAYPESFSELRGMLDRGDVRGAVVFAAGTQAEIEQGGQADVQVISDGTMSNDAGIIFSYVSGVFSKFNEAELFRLTRAEGLPADLQTISMFNENLDSRFYYVPGLVAMTIMITSILLTSIAIVREKEIGTIEQVMVTPIGRLEFILGKTLPFFITGYFTTSIMFLVAFMFFDIVIKGSVFLLALVTGLNIIAYLGLALLISASAYTQQQALLTAFFVMMPCALLSGFMFPVDNMPVPIQYLTYLDPMRWGFEAITGIVIKGTGAADMYRQLFWQTAHAVFFVVFASMKFRKTLE